MTYRPFTSKRAPFYAEVPDEKWNSWRWQLSNRINSVEEFEKVIPLARRGFETVLEAGEHVDRHGIAPGCWCGADVSGIGP